LVNSPGSLDAGGGGCVTGFEGATGFVSMGFTSAGFVTGAAWNILVNSPGSDAAG